MTSRESASGRSQLFPSDEKGGNGALSTAGPRTIDSGRSRLSSDNLELAPHQRKALDSAFEGLPDRPLVAWSEIRTLADDLVDRIEPLGTALASNRAVSIRRYDIAKVATCPASARSTPFEWNPRLAKRTVGLMALHDVINQECTPQFAVTEVIEAAVAEGTNLGAWLDRQDHAVRHATIIEATSWVNTALVAFPVHQVNAKRFGRKTYFPSGRGNPISFVGDVDAELVRRGIEAQERLLLDFRRASPDVVAFEVLINAISTRRAPLRYVSVDTATGQVAVVDVTIELLRSAVEACVSAARARVDLEVRVDVETVPSKACWWCDVRDDCKAGAEWMSSQPRRVAGIPC